MMQENYLPASWVENRLGDFVHYQKGKKPKSLSSNMTSTYSIPYVNIKAFEKGVVDEYTNGEGCVFCEHNEFLMVWDGARSGYIGRALKGALGSTLVKIKFPGVNMNYAYYYLQSKYVEINTNAKGTGIPHVDPELVWNYRFPLPPLLEQHRIVAKIEELFSELDKGIETLNKAKEQLKIYRQAVLKYAFEGKLTNPDVKEGELPDGWEFKKLSEIGVWRGGGTPSKSNKAFWDNGTIDWVTSKDMKSDIILNTIDMITLDSLVHSSAKLIPANSILFVMRSGILRRTLPISMVQHEVTINQDLQALTPLDTNIKYLFWCLKSSSETIRRFCSKDGTTVESIDSLALKRFQVAIAPKDQQEMVVQEIESRLSVCDKIEESIEQGLQQAEALRQSILKKAFEGKLVPQDPNDEPACVLLERIKAERAAAQSEKKVRAKKTKA